MFALAMHLPLSATHTHHRHRVDPPTRPGEQSAAHPPGFSASPTRSPRRASGAGLGLAIHPSPERSGDLLRATDGISRWWGVGPGDSRADGRSGSPAARGGESDACGLRCASCSSAQGYVENQRGGAGEDLRAGPGADCRPDPVLGSKGGGINLKGAAEEMGDLPGNSGLILSQAVRRGQMHSGAPVPPAAAGFRRLLDSAGANQAWRRGAVVPGIEQFHLVLEHSGGFKVDHVPTVSAMDSAQRFVAAKGDGDREEVRCSTQRGKIQTISRGSVLSLSVSGHQKTPADKGADESFYCQLWFPEPRVPSSSIHRDGAPPHPAVSSTYLSMADLGRGRGRGKGKGNRGNTQGQNPGQQGAAPWGPEQMGAPPPFLFPFGFQQQPWTYPGAWQGQQQVAPWQGPPPPWIQPPPPMFGGLGQAQVAAGQNQSASGNPVHQGGPSGGGGNQARAQQQQQPKQQVKQLPKKAPNSPIAEGAGLMSYSDVVCLNYGEPGHDQEGCSKAKSCKICKMITHQVDACPVRKQPHKSARYIGSGAPGLGFYHVDLPEVNAQKLGVLQNIGKVYIEDGLVTKTELAEEFSGIYKTNWPWVIRALDDWTYLVKFPPEIPVEQVAGYPCFGLSKVNVTVNVEVWDGKIQHVSEAQEVWVTIRGMNPRWCEWVVIDQITSVFGLLTVVDWTVMINSFYEEVKVRVMCRDYTKIPNERHFFLDGKFFLLSFEVEIPVDGNDLVAVTNPSTENGNGQNSSMDTDKDPGNKSKDGTNLEKSNNSSSSTISSRKGSGSQTGKQQVLEFLEQVQDIPTTPSTKLHSEAPSPLQPARRELLGLITGDHPEDESSFNILREMDLVDDVGQFNYEIEELQENDDSEKTVRSDSTAGEVQEAVGPTKNQVVAAKKWGPVPTTRYSNRVDLGGKTMLERAQNYRKVVNLEVPKIKDLEIDPKDSQGLGHSLPTHSKDRDGAFLFPCGGPLEKTPPPDKWLDHANLSPDAAQAISAAILGALHLSDGPAPSSPPRKSSKAGLQMALSPVSVMGANCWSPLKTGTPLKKAKNI